MNLSIYGEISIDILINSNTNIYSRIGGAGLYAAISAARQESTVQFMTVYNSEIDEYTIQTWKRNGINFDLAEKKDNYQLPKYLVTGFNAFENKQSIPLNNLSVGINFVPEIKDDCEGLLIFPIDHDIPIEICKIATHMKIPIFLDPKPNEKSIFKARQLLNYVTFLLVNEEEAMLLSEESNLDSAMTKLSTSGPRYIIVKLGHKGCIFVDADKHVHFPAYKSRVECTLGSGDSFGGAFAATYLATKDIEYSIKIASCVAANFIESIEIEGLINRKGIEHDLRVREYSSYNTQYRKLYLAGPFFNAQERIWLNNVCVKLERAQFKVLSPSRENGIISADTNIAQRHEIYKKDLKLIEESELMVALLDHDDPGTFFEIGYANKKGIPVFGLKTSSIETNNMILFGCDFITNSVEELIYMVYNHAQ